MLLAKRMAKKRKRKKQVPLKEPKMGAQRHLALQRRKKEGNTRRRQKMNPCQKEKKPTKRPIMVGWRWTGAMAAPVPAAAAPVPALELHHLAPLTP